MPKYQPEPIAIVGLAAIMPDAPDASAFWENIKAGRYSISDVPPDRWDPDLYYDADRRAPDKTYSRIGGWVREYPWDPIGWRLPLPPKVAEQMDQGQKWALAAARAALLDAGWPDWDVDPEQVAVILGNAIGGEKHYATNVRIVLPEMLRELEIAPSFASLPENARLAIVEETRKGHLANFVEINEDTMPGELANVTAGRIANLFNFRGPNFTTDAACASGLAGMWSAAQGLASRQYDVAVSGGVDRNMGVTSFVKFCKIGALSATGTRPFDAGADGFVMGEGAAIFVMKRLSDAERAGDRVYAVLLGMAGSSDGKGKGITAPNPAGQRLAIARAWQQAGVDPAMASAIEAHGTSTRVGDASELESLTSVFGPAGVAPGAIALGSVKSNIGHLKAAAGTAGLFKMVMNLHEKVLAPSLNFDDPNPSVDWANSPFRVNTDLREWPAPPGGVRLGGVSAFGFGGTNFHAVLEEYVPGRHRSTEPRSFAGMELPQPTLASEAVASDPDARRALVIGGSSDDDVVAQLERARDDASAGQVPSSPGVDPASLGAAVRLAIDYGDAAELARKAEKALEAFASGNAAIWRMLKSQGVFLGHGPAPKVAFLYTGQGSQYVNMLKPLRESEPIVAATFAEADRIMLPLLGRPLSEYIFSDRDDAETVARLDRQLLQTEITQPAVLTCDIALTRLLAAHGVQPDMVMGHSLGEYGALVAAGALDFSASLEAVSARGHEMASLDIDDNGAMAAVFGPLPEIERIVAEADGYVVVANVNSNDQAVIGGATEAIERVIETFQAAGFTARRIPVSHAFHTSIVAPISEPLKEVLRRLEVHAPTLPIVANVTGEFYPADTDAETMVEILGRQVASPVQFVKGLHTLYDAGVRVFVEVGPKKALHGFVEDVFGPAHDDVVALFTNHPKLRDATAFNQALCGLYAAGLGLPASASPAPKRANDAAATPVTPPTMTLPAAETTITEPRTSMNMDVDKYVELGKVFAEFLERGRHIYDADPAPAPANGLATHEPVVVTGAALGLPGVKRVFDDENIGRILDGQQFIDAIPHRLRQAMVDKHITRLIKPESGEPSFVAIDDEADVIKLAGRRAPFDVVTEFGVDESRDAALDSATRLAIGAGFDALRDAGIPLVMRYRTTTLGTQLADRWGLADEMRDDTGVVFASAFPGYGEFAKDIERYMEDRGRRHELASLQAVRSRMGGDEAATGEVDRRIAELQHLLAIEPFEFDRRFLFRCLAMGHSQFAELIGARGPNTQVNAACASTTQALCIAEDWIRTGRARRVVVIAADDVTSDALLPWVGSGFLASGAAATDDVVEDAAVPFDRRRHGMIVGMGAAAIVVESADAARERGVQPICEVLGAVTANSAFHGTRLDVAHVSQVMEQLLRQVESRGIDRHAMARSTVFVSHETYTPARGGSAAAEISALRSAFGSAADEVVVTNTKGFTGHAMGAGIEDVVAIKALETGIVPPVPNFKEPDPELGELNLSTGGAHPVDYALRLAAGFGSQIAMAVLRWTPMPDRVRRSPDQLGFRYRIVDPVAWRGWLLRISGQPDAELEVVQHRLRVIDKLAHPSAPVPVAALVPAPAVVADHPAPPAIVSSELPVTVPPPSQMPAMAETTVDPIVEAVVSIVSEMTGYPPELLDLDLDLEADLGVDTVKQAEVFAAVRERFGVERDEHLKLRDFPTLNHVVGWVKDKTATVVPDVAAELAGPEPAADVAVDPMVEAVVSIVSEMTGYPPELLDLDLDLEADLGVDTVKQAEVFAAVRERFGVERDEHLKLREFPTLNHVVGWITDKVAAVERTVEPTPAAGSSSELTGPEMGGDRAATDRYPRRVPVAVLRPSLDLCKQTGVALDSNHRVVVMLDEGGVGANLVERLTERGCTSLVLDAGMDAEKLAGTLDGWLADGPVSGVYWLPALDDEGPIEAMDPPAWHDALVRRVKNLYVTMRCLYDGQPFLVAATRLGGYHGYDETGATAPLGGAVSGFAKAYRREQPDALVKVVDVPGGRDAAAVASLLVDETLRDPGCVEVGYPNDGLRWTVGLAEAPFSPATDKPLDAGSVFVVTGAAGSIVSAITADLAAASGGTFHLLDLTPAPDPDDPDLQRFVTDKDGLKSDLAARLKEGGQRPTPVLIEKQLARIERLAAAHAAVRAVTEAGGTARYHQVDLTDVDAVARVMGEVRDSSGRVDVLLHAAGLEISRSLPDKEPPEFDLVFDVKSDGWFNVLHAMGNMPLGATVAFSSVAGRFGNVGQTDYSAANDLLCKLTSNLRRTRPATRAIALDWTAWAGIGMATRGSIPKVMQMAGIETLAPETGIAWIRRELTSGADGGEVLVAGALGRLVDEFDETGGIEAGTVPLLSGPMLGTVEAAGVYSGVVVRTTLDPKHQPFLNDHRIDGTAVLPGVMGIEAFAEVARLLAPSWQVVAVEDVEFLAPVKFYRDEPRTLTIRATIRRDGRDLIAVCAVEGERLLPGSDEPQHTTHFTGTVRLAADAPPPDHADAVTEATETVASQGVYDLYFHGPAYQVVSSSWRYDGGNAARMADGLPDDHAPMSAPTFVGPRLVELCFQTAGLWEAAQHGRLALPRHVDAVRLLRDPAQVSGPLYAVANEVDDHFDCSVRDADGEVVLTVEGYRTTPLPVPLSADVRQGLGALAAEVLPT